MKNNVLFKKFVLVGWYYSLICINCQWNIKTADLHSVLKRPAADGELLLFLLLMAKNELLFFKLKIGFSTKWLLHKFSIVKKCLFYSKVK